jgi:protein TonB
LFAAAPVPGPAEGTAAATPSKTAEQSVDQSKAAPDLGATTPSPAGKVWNITELDQIPIVRLQTQPVFPSELKKAGMKAEVIVSWVLDLDGNVGEVKVYSSTDHRFDQASMDAVRQWKFRPGMKDGHPVKVAMTCPIVFTFTP